MPARVAVLLAAALFGTTGTAQELGPDAATPLGVGPLRIAVGAGALWLFAAPTFHRPAGRHGPMLLLGAAAVAGYQVTFFTGTDRAGVTLGTIVALGSGPAFAGAMEAMRCRRPPPRAWVLATLVAVSGGALLVAAEGGTATFDTLGMVAAVAAGLSYAVYATATKVLIEHGMDSTTALAAMFTLGALLVAPLALREPLGWLTTGAGRLMIAHLGVVTVGLAYWLYGRGLRELPTSTAVLLTLAEPVTAALAAFVVLDERLSAVAWCGGALVIAGLFLGARQPGPTPAFPPEG